MVLGIDPNTNFVYSLRAEIDDLGPDSISFYSISYIIFLKNYFIQTHLTPELIKEHNARSKGFFTGKRFVPKGSTHIFIYFYLFFSFFCSKRRSYSKKAGSFKIPRKLKILPKCITPFLSSNFFLHKFFQVFWYIKKAAINSLTLIRTQDLHNFYYMYFHKFSSY